MPYTLEELEDLSQDEIMEVISELYGTTLSPSERTALMRDTCDAKGAIAMMQKLSGCSHKEARESFAQGLEHGMLRPEGMSAAQARELAAFIRRDA